MSDITLESLAARVDALERQLAERNSSDHQAERKKDWRKSIGMFAGSEFMDRVNAESAAIREAERIAARREPVE